jgi:hypothetical protein
MRFVAGVVAVGALTVSIGARGAEIPINELFARDMITCAFKHVTFALGPGDASLAQNAAVEAEVYLVAAARATSEDFVKSESSTLKTHAEEAVFAAMGSVENVEGIIAVWRGTKEKCDKQVASFTSAGDR